MKIYLNKSIINVLLLITLTILLASIGQYMLINMYYILFCTFFLIKNDDKTLFLTYLVFLPTNGLISTQYNFMGILHTSYIINLFTTLLIIFKYKYFKIKSSNFKKRNREFTNTVKNIILFLALYLIFNNFKDFYMGIDNQGGLESLITRSIRYIVLFFPLYFLSSFTISDKYNKIFFNGLFLGLLLLSFSILFSFQLSDLGLRTQESIKDTFLIFGDNLIRKAGFFGYGDENSIAGYLAIGTTVLIYKYNIKRNLLLAISIFLIIPLAILSTGSRTGFVCFIISVFYYVFSKKGFSYKAFALVITLLIVNVLYFYGYFDSIISRFYNLDNITNTTDLTSRMGGWIFYISYIISNLNVLLIGSWENIYDVLRIVSTYDRVAHNFFITLVYNKDSNSFFILFNSLNLSFNFSFSDPSGVAEYFLTTFFISF